MKEQQTNNSYIRQATNNETNRIQCIVRKKETLECLNELSSKLNVSRNRILNDALELALPLLIKQYDLKGGYQKGAEEINNQFDNFMTAFYDLSNNGNLDLSNNGNLDLSNNEDLNKSKGRFSGISLEEMYNSITLNFENLTSQLTAIANQILETTALSIKCEKNTSNASEKMGEIKQQIRSLEELTSRENIAVKSTQMMTSYSANFITTIFKGLCYPKFPSMDSEKIKDFQKKSSYTLLSPFKEEYETEIEKLNEQIRIRRKNEEGKL